MNVYAGGARIATSEFDLNPVRQGPVVRIPRTSPVHRIIRTTPKGALMRRPSAAVQEMGFFSVIALIIKLVLFVKSIVDFIRDLIEGSLVKALLALIGFVAPVFGPIFDVGKLGLGFITDVVDDIAAALEGIVGSAVDLIFDTIGIPGVDISKITQLDVFDTVSDAARTAAPEVDLRDFIKESAGDIAKGQLLPDIPVSPEDWADRAVDETVDKAVKKEIAKTPLGKAAITASDAADLAEQGQSLSDAISEADISEHIPSLDDLTDAIPPIPAVPSPAALVEKGKALASGVEDRIMAEKRNLEEKLAASNLLEQAEARAREELQKQLERVKKLAMEELYKFIMGFLLPGQTFASLSDDQRAMIMAQIRLKWPDWEIPSFNFEMFDSPFWKYRKWIMGGGAAAILGTAGFMIFGGGE